MNEHFTRATRIGIKRFFTLARSYLARRCMGNSLCRRVSNWESFLSQTEQELVECDSERLVFRSSAPTDEYEVSKDLENAQPARAPLRFRTEAVSSSNPNFRNEIKVLRFVGSGSFGSVYLIRRCSDNALFALKSMRKDRIVQTRQVDHANQERELLSRVNLPFIMRLVCTFQDPTHVHLVLEFAPGGDLFERLQTCKRFTESVARFYAAQILMIFEYMHKLHILYRDLKPENILLGANGYVKLCDFGFAKFVPSRTYTLCGTPDYLAPEMILSKGYNTSVDWWSYGVLLFEMLFGASPFQSEEILVLYEKITIGAFTFPKSPHVSKAARDLIHHLLQVDLTKRYGLLKRHALDIREHAWFCLTNWDGLYRFSVRPPYLPNKVTPLMEGVALGEVTETEDPFASQFPMF